MKPINLDTTPIYLLPCELDFQIDQLLWYLIRIDFARHSQPWLTCYYRLQEDYAVGYIE